MIFDSLINKFSSNPKTLFLADGIGAIFSATFLGIILVKLNHLIGLPVATLLILSAAACVFALFSFSCYRFLFHDFSVYIQIIATINLLYCLVSIGILCYYRDQLLPLGYIYFIAEKLIVITLVYIEFKAAKKLKKTN